MAEQEPVPWKTCSDYILECGSQHEPYRFSLAVLEKIRDIVPYDQALFLMLDGNRKIARRHFIGFTDRWMSMYLNYYSRSTETDFSLDQEASEIDGRGTSRSSTGMSSTGSGTTSLSTTSSRAASPSRFRSRSSI